MHSMNATLEPRLSAPPSLESSITEALDRIPPLWPLGHFVAVNPFAGFAHLPFVEACQILQRTVGSAPLQSPAEYLAALEEGKICSDDLVAVAEDGWTFERLVAVLKAAKASPEVEVIPTVADLLDRQRPHAHWSDFVVEEISKWCGVAFDENQTTWKFPWKSIGLFDAWREVALHDRNPEAFGLVGFRKFVAFLPESTDACIGYCMDLIAPQRIDPVDFLHRQLVTIAGWAGYVRYLVREDELRGVHNPSLRELLAIRLAYDAALFHAFVRDGTIREHWKHQAPPLQNRALLSALHRWQSAYEAGYVRALSGALATQPSEPPLARPEMQAVFCIDVRSEIFRRQLEAARPGIQTIGFAGFFGFPVSHRSAGAEAAASRCPVLLVPLLESCEPGAAAARLRQAEKGAWKAFQNSAASCFSFVESLGLGFVALLGRSRARPRTCCQPALPALPSATLESRVAMAEGALRNMSLTKNFARLVLVCGHGSHSANNPYASSLDCGACGGHAGDVNARLAAATLNDPGVRKTLLAKGILIPEDTLFIAGLHDTLSDDVTIFDQMQIPPSHAEEVSLMKQALAKAGAAARQERALALGLIVDDPERLASGVRARGRDISQVRPEWGLVNNAALVVAPRPRSAALKLEGRVFLHDYAPEDDPDLKVLTLILCAPVVVASWINLQYYASRVDPLHYGSGDKALHHVVGGIGVMEGNGGDLKTGLPIQSLHDGGRFLHEPRRLTVVIDARRISINQVLAKHDAVRQLIDHGWIHLVALEGKNAYRRIQDGWVRIKLI
ncbi:MAG TPA: DUF2309 domain-containing protein [Verrucomicrobiales bacterium]|nr:DUF2309 domain-containing protein [Verrucomicrobiales bacterium]